MQAMKWLAILLSGILIAACFMPWVIIESRHMVISGFHSDVPNFGKPGMTHVFLTSIFILLVFVQKIWSIRTAFFMGAVNIAWAARNYFIISACRAGICPEKQSGLYLVLGCSIFMVLALLFIPVKGIKAKDAAEIEEIEEASK